jgi:hypothetical protein
MRTIKQITSLFKKFEGIFTKSQKDTVEQQKELVKWTRRMAKGAFVAAGLTFFYVIFTGLILLQTVHNSSLEFRPYVILNDIVGELKGIEQRSDSIRYNSYISMKFVNPGKTPAVSFSTSSGIYKSKKIVVIDEETDPDAEYNTVLMGTSDFGRGLHFSITIPKEYVPGSSCCVNWWDGSFTTEIDSSYKGIFYLHSLYSYWDINKKKRYPGYAVVELIFNPIDTTLQARINRLKMD